MNTTTPRTKPACKRQPALAYEVLVKTYGTSETLEPIEPVSVFLTRTAAERAASVHKNAFPFRLTMRIRAIG